MARKRIGNQVPTKSVFLPYKRSEYKKAINLYEKSGKKVLKWQTNLLKPLLALNPDGLYTHTKFGYAIPRRNGKNEVVLIREIYGLINKQKILHTAHRTTTSHSAWERLKDALLDCGYIDGEDFTSQKALGRERIEFADGGRVEFRTRTSSGGLGEGFDLLVIDEAQEYTEDHESALKYVVTDSANPQTIFCGTPPTPVSAGTVFMAFRDKTLDSSTKNAAWAEWSVERMVDVRDKSFWYATSDLIVCRYSKQPAGVEKAELIVITGTPTTGAPEDPPHIAGDIFAGDTLAEMPLYRIPLGGITVGMPVALFDVISMALQREAAIVQSISLALPKTGGTVTGTLTQQGMFKLGSVNYGNTLPEPGNPGRIFFKKV